MDLIIFCIMISNIPETDPIEHVRWRICISTLGKSFSDIAIDLNFLQRTMNRNQFSAAIIRITLKLFVRVINFADTLRYLFESVTDCPYSRFEDFEVVGYH